MLILYNPVSTSPGKTVMPMSLLSLGAVLEGKYPYQIVDGNLINNHADTLIELLKSNRAAALGITVMAGPQLNQAVPLVKKIKANLPTYPLFGVVILQLSTLRRCLIPATLITWCAVRAN